MKNANPKLFFKKPLKETPGRFFIGGEQMGS
jgi:hypothetical protein